MPADFWQLLEAEIEGEQASHTPAQRREHVDHREACVDVRQGGEHDMWGQGRALHPLQEAHAADPGACTRQCNGIIVHKVAVSMEQGSATG